MLIYSHKISFTMIDEEFWCFHILNIRVHHFRNLAWSVSSVCGALYHNGRQDTWWTIHLLPEKFHFLAFGPSKYQSRGFLSPEESCSDYALWCYFITYHVYWCDIMLHTLLVLMLLQWLETGQMSMGAGHCPLGGFTDWNVCNVHGEVHLASRYRAMLRPRSFSRFDTLPATLAHCQYFRIILEGAPCRPTIFKVPNIVGTLPKVPHLTLIVHNWPHTYLLWPKLAQKMHIFVDIWPWPLTLGHKKLFLQRPDQSPCRIWINRSNGSAFLGLWHMDGRTDGQFVGNMYGFIHDICQSHNFAIWLYCCVPVRLRLVQTSFIFPFECRGCI